MECLDLSISVMARRSNLKIFLTLLLISLCAFILLLTYQLMSAGNNKSRKYDLHVEDDFEDNPVREPNSNMEPEIRDVIVSSPTRLPDQIPNEGTKNIAIGCAVTSHKEEHLSVENVAYKLPFLRTLVPSFCKTASNGYHYHFYAAFDVRDPHLGREQYMEAVYQTFNEIVNNMCSKQIRVFLHFVQCNHNHNPTWAQNDAMMEAYLDHMDYYYRVNDDTQMLTPGWTETYIDGLQGFSPPNVGVVGPLHKGGNEAILTYDFVHRKHIDIFGFYYPRVFTDWWADNWITSVYGSTRTLKLPSVRLVHTGEAGTRYEVKPDKQRFLKEQIEEDQLTLERYLKSVEVSSQLKPSDQVKVISMSLWGSKTRYTYGALRNAQLLPVYFPQWSLRLYVEKPRDDGATTFAPIPNRLIDKLSKLGAVIMHVDVDRSHVPPMMWRFLVADDMDVDIFIVRDSDCRLTDRDAKVVDDWLSVSESPFHCIRDHPNHATYPVLGGLWGGRPKKLREVMPIPWRDLMMGVRSDYTQDMSFLANAIWPKVQKYAYCHDSVSCKTWPNAYPFPEARVGTEHLGQVFDAFGNARDDDIQSILDHRPVLECYTSRRVNITTSTRPLQSVSSSKDIELFSTTRSSILDKKKKIIPEADSAFIGHINATSTMLSNPKSKTALKTKGYVLLSSRTSPPNLRFDANASSTVVRSSKSRLVAKSFNTTVVNGEKPRLVVVWTMDYSNEPLETVKHLASSTDLRFVDKSLASSCQLTRTCAKNLRIISKKNGLDLTTNLIKSFHEEYESDVEMNLVTHFLCINPPSMCEIYIPFGRPIVVYINNRYEQTRYSSSQWKNWNKVLATIAADRRNLIVASNRYDARYLQYFTGIDPPVIPLHCGYSNFSYQPTVVRVVFFPTPFPTFDEYFVGKMKAHLGNSSLPHTFLTSDSPSILASSQLVIHIPYEISSNALYQHYANNIPIFIPTIDLLIQWHHDFDILDMLTWNSVRSLMGEVSDRSPIGAAPGIFNIPDPNQTRNITSLKYWLPLSPFYRLANLVYFDSFSHLISEIEKLDLDKISKNMAATNKKIKNFATKQWRNVFN